MLRATLLVLKNRYRFCTVRASSFPEKSFQKYVFFWIFQGGRYLYFARQLVVHLFDNGHFLYSDESAYFCERLFCLYEIKFFAG